MNRRQLRLHIVRLLLDEDLERIREEIARLPESRVMNALFSCLCHPHERVRWRAVSGFGFLLPVIADRNMEDARTVMRRFVWMLNDESGGIGWGVPEAMGEVMAHCPELGGEYLHMLVSYTLDDGPECFQDGNFLELEQLQEGVLWGLCRTAPRYRTEMLGLSLADNLGIYFESGSATVRGLVCRLCGLLGLDGWQERVGALLADPAPVRYYHEGSFTDTTVSALAVWALSVIGQGRTR